MTDAAESEPRALQRSTTLVDLPAATGGPDPVAPTRNWRAENALALMGLGGFLFLPAIVSVAAKATVIAGLPLIWIYLFGVWMLLIVGAAALARRGAGWSDDSEGRASWERGETEAAAAAPIAAGRREDGVSPGGAS